LPIPRRRTLGSGHFSRPEYASSRSTSGWRRGGRGPRGARFAEERTKIKTFFLPMWTTAAIPEAPHPLSDHAWQGGRFARPSLARGRRPCFPRRSAQFAHMVWRTIRRSGVYFARPTSFPIIHAVAFAASLVESSPPWLADHCVLLRLFSKPKRFCMKELWPRIGHLRHVPAMERRRI